MRILVFIGLGAVAILVLWYFFFGGSNSSNQEKKNKNNPKPYQGTDGKWYIGNGKPYIL